MRTRTDVLEKKVNLEAVSHNVSVHTYFIWQQAVNLFKINYKVKPQGFQYHCCVKPEQEMHFRVSDACF